MWGLWGQSLGVGTQAGLCPHRALCLCQVSHKESEEALQKRLDELSRELCRTQSSHASLRADAEKAQEQQQRAAGVGAAGGCGGSGGHTGWTLLAVLPGHCPAWNGNSATCRDGDTVVVCATAPSSAAQQNRPQTRQMGEAATQGQAWHPPGPLGPEGCL